jgi:hypothetical protein
VLATVVGPLSGQARAFLGIGHMGQVLRLVKVGVNELSLCR